jgi:hypothetical protein
VATAVAVGLADLYSDILGVEARERRRAHTDEWREALHDALAVGFGVGFPAVLFVLASAGAIELQTAFDVAVWSGLGLIAVYGYLAARLRGAGRGNALLHASAAALIAGVLIVLKSLVH